VRQPWRVGLEAWHRAEVHPGRVHRLPTVESVDVV
jgi:hypothetical protein